MYVDDTPSITGHKNYKTNRPLNISASYTDELTDQNFQISITYTNKPSSFSPLGTTSILLKCYVLNAFRICPTSTSKIRTQSLESFDWMSLRTCHYAIRSNGISRYILRIYIHEQWYIFFRWLLNRINVLCEYLKKNYFHYLRLHLTQMEWATPIQFSLTICSITSLVTFIHLFICLLLPSTIFIFLI